MHPVLQRTPRYQPGFSVIITHRHARCRGVGTRTPQPLLSCHVSWEAALLDRSPLGELFRWHGWQHRALWRQPGPTQHRAKFKLHTLTRSKNKTGEKMISPASPPLLNLSGSPQVKATWNTCGSEMNIFCRDLEFHLMLLNLWEKSVNIYSCFSHQRAPKTLGTTYGGTIFLYSDADRKTSRSRKLTSVSLHRKGTVEQNSSNNSTVCLDPRRLSFIVILSIVATQTLNQHTQYITWLLLKDRTDTELVLDPILMWFYSQKQRKASQQLAVCVRSGSGGAEVMLRRTTLPTEIWKSFTCKMIGSSC